MGGAGPKQNTQGTARQKAQRVDGRLPADFGTLGIKALVFDLDGVVTSTASVHAKAWKDLFDPYLKTVAERTGQPFVPFDIRTDYARYVDGLPRYDGVDAFLRSRGILLPRGTPDDPPDRETVCGLGNRKNEAFNRALREHGVEVFPGAVRFIEHYRRRGQKTAVNSSSKNAVRVLEAADIAHLFDAIVDGRVAEAENLRGKPAPDTFLRAAAMLGARPAETAVFEDAIPGVQSGRAGGFRLVVGIDRGAGRQALLDGGADIVVNDLGDFPLG